VVSEINGRLGDELRFVYRHFPLSEIHPYAALAAQAAEAAGAQRRFWEMHETLFENQDRLALPDVVHYARLLGLNVGRFEAELVSGTHLDRVTEDFLSGRRSGVSGTPTFFINGVRHRGSYELPVLLSAVLAAAQGRPDPAMASLTGWQFPSHLGR
jgi:protein-disulfide isomerase